MNLYKTLSKTSTFLNARTPVHLNPFSPSFFSTNIFSNEQDPQLHTHIEQNNESAAKELKRPSEIAYQPKVANWVSLIGTIRMPIEFLTCTDGTAWAGTLISQDQLSSTLPLLWIPVIFKGDLAHTAMMHLKEQDTIYVAGHLSPDLLPINLTKDERSVQVMVHDVHFVRGVKNPFFRRSEPPIFS